MSKASASAFTKLKELVDAGKFIQIEKTFKDEYEVTVFESHSLSAHSHYNGRDIIEILMKL